LTVSYGAKKVSIINFKTLRCKNERISAKKTHLLLRLHLRNSIDIVLMGDFAPATPEGDHARLDTDSLEHSATELIRAAREFGPVDTLIDGHLAAVDL
jgi:hypothetical protein